MEIFGHEFWSPDGKTIWYDLQTPRGEDFWLAGYNVETGERTLVSPAAQRVVDPLQRDARRQAVLRRRRRPGPGGARARRQVDLPVPSRADPNRGIDDKSFVQPGVLRAEQLVNMSKHKYRLEPNVSFTPDQKWVVFRSNMFGADVRVRRGSGESEIMSSR